MNANKKDGKLTSDQYLKLLRQPRKAEGYTQITVTNYVELPKDIEELPDVPTTFTGGLDARGTKLTRFNHKVCSSRGAHFEGSTIRELGPNIRFDIFTTVNLRYTDVEAINFRAHRIVLGNNPQLNSFGPQALFSQIVLEPQQLPLLLQLKQLPTILELSSKAGVTGPFAPLADILTPHSRDCHSPIGVETLARYTRLLTEPEKQLLESYDVFAELSVTLMNTLYSVGYTKDRLQKVELDLNQRLQRLAAAKVRQASHQFSRKHPA